MADIVYRKTALVGASSSIEQAITVALERANKTLRNIDWFEVDQIRGRVESGKIVAYQVTLNVGFRVD